jgi:hypothetical protein
MPTPRPSVRSRRRGRYRRSAIERRGPREPEAQARGEDEEAAACAGEHETETGGLLVVDEAFMDVGPPGLSLAKGGSYQGVAENIGPTRARTKNTQRSEQNGQVSENGVARANPCGSHVCIALTVCP